MDQMNKQLTRQIQELVRQLTDKPLRYLANTTYHGDHTFGNSAFPRSVTIVSSRQNRDSTRALADEKRMRFGNLRQDAQAFADVRTWRLPDVVFERYGAIELGDRLVELWQLSLETIVPGHGPRGQRPCRIVSPTCSMCKRVSARPLQPG
jgi:cyclase